jgi:hypothetical protein
VTGRWFSTGTRVSSTNKTDRDDIAEILLKVVLNTINLNLILTSFTSTMSEQVIKASLYVNTCTLKPVLCDPPMEH